jgi:outer membrane protein assembly factor BamB
MLSVSANGTKKDSGIVWATLPDSDCAPTPLEPCDHPPSPDLPGWLYAFHAETLEPLWDGGFGSILAHWVPPTIANGMVFIPAGSEFTKTGEMLLVYELGAEDGSERKRGVTHQPRQGQIPYPCVSCHGSEQNVQQQLAQRRPLRDRYPNEASLRVLPALSSSMVAPPPGHIKMLALEGNGLQIYEANESDGKLIWNSKGSTADLTEVRQAGAEKENGSGPVRVRLSLGPLWSSSDSSTIRAELQKRAPAPESTDAPWVLFKVVKSSGQGILSNQSYIQCVYTHAGHAPATPPKGRGEIAKVPYYGQYWFYR